MAAFGEYTNKCPHGIDKLSNYVCLDCKINKLEKENKLLKEKLKICDSTIFEYEKRMDKMQKERAMFLEVMKQNDLHFNLCKSLHEEDGVCDCYDKF